ncbi:MAG: hypothetical protein KatS3mg111_4119 [Pirellulaceae bacterium]|nr:MAG: hypothetical protein KatS3mg111_4119 [Pirellulaceae bacterium]
MLTAGKTIGQIGQTLEKSKGEVATRHEWAATRRVSRGAKESRGGQAAEGA